MTEIISAKLKALSAVQLTSQARDEHRLDDVFWSTLINKAWEGKALMDRRSHQAEILAIINEAVRNHQDREV